MKPALRLFWQMALDEAAHCGFSHAALLPARRLDEYSPGEEARRQRIGGDPFALLSQARSVLVCAMPFAWHDIWPEDCAQVSAFYFQSQRAHAAIRLLAERLRAGGAQVCTEQRLPAKLLAREAGLGILGKNALLQNDLWGSCFTLHILLTDIDPPDIPSNVIPSTACGDCARCVKACPTGALDGHGRVDTQRCLRAYMLTGEVVPETFRPFMEHRLLGCEICQRACPHNARLPFIRPEADAFAIEGLLLGERRTLDCIARHIGLNEARKQRLQSQAAIVAGNTGSRRYLPLLEPLARHERPSISIHAQWALSQIKKRSD